jgi:hypothetical protein
MQSVSSDTVLARWQDATAHGLVRPVRGGDARLPGQAPAVPADTQTRQAIHTLRLTLDRLPE